MNQIFFYGCVENRLDPLKLGRCQVRILGIHTENKIILPTEDLPWSYPIQPITSAGISGIGHAPIGSVEGTWVIIIFADEDQQQPMILGTIGGIPQDKTGMNTTSESDDFVSGIGTSSVSVSGSSSDLTPPEPLTENSGLIGPLAILIAKAESGKTGYNAFNRGTSGGKIIPSGGSMNLTEMQISEIMSLQALPPGSSNRLFAVGRYQCIPETLKEAVKSLNIDNTRKFNQITQDLICQEYLLSRKRKPLSVYYKSSDKTDEVLLKNAGRALAAEFASIEDPYNIGYPYGGKNGKYYRGGNRAHTMWESQIKPTLLQEWDFRNGSKPSVSSQLGEPPVENPEAPSTKAAASNILGDILKVVAEVTNIPALGELNLDGSTSSGIKGSNGIEGGFSDPTGTYPLYVKEPDTNRLAINNNIESTMIMQKEAALDIGVMIANGGTWDQSPAPYNAEYPFNHVYQSESGHILEFDDTNGSERIHLYHKTGTFVEIDSNGTQVNRIVGDGFEILERNGFVHVKGSLNVTVDGAYNLRVDNTLNLEVSGNALINIFDTTDINISGDANISVGGDFNLRAANINLESDGEVNIKSGSTTDIHSNADFNLKSDANINMESSKDSNLKASSTINIEASNDINQKALSDINMYAVNNMKTLVGSDSLLNIGKSYNTKTGGVLSLESSDKMNLSGANIDIKADSALNEDYATLSQGLNSTSIPVIASIVNNQNTATALEAGLSNLVPPADIRGTSDLPSLPALSVASRGAEVGFDDPDAGDATGYNANRVDSNIVSAGDIMADKIVLDSAKPVGNSSTVPISANCDYIFNMPIEQFNPNTKLSEYFTLGDMTKGGTRIPRKDYVVKGRNDAVGVIYKPQEIICNLKGVCINVLDPIAKKYGRDSFIITSGFRRPAQGNVPGDIGMDKATGKPAIEGGDHNRGCAVDIQFTAGRARMFQIANELVTLLPSWNQIILEYDGKSCWIHVAFKYTGNKGDYFTMNHNSKYGGTFPKGGFILI